MPQAQRELLVSAKQLPTPPDTGSETRTPARKAPAATTTPTKRTRKAGNDQVIERKKQRKDDASSEQDSTPSDASLALTPTPATKKRKTTTAEMGTPAKVKVKAKRTKTEASRTRIPVYRPTSDPDEKLLLDYREGVEPCAIYQISREIDVPKATIKQQGRVKDYDLTQMGNWFITRMLNKLEKVLQERHRTERDKKNGLRHCLSEANKAMPDDVPNAKISEARENGGSEDSTAMVWYNEPVYELLMVEDIFDDPNLLIAQISSTHGKLFIRVDSISIHWTDFVKWIDVDQGSMEMSKRIEKSKLGYFNGYTISEWTDESEIRKLSKELVDINDIFEKHGCIAVWKTGPGSLE